MNIYIRLAFFVLLPVVFSMSLKTVYAQHSEQYWEGNLVVEFEGNKTYLPFTMKIKTDGKGACQGENTLWVEVKGRKYFSRVLQKCTCTNDGELTFSDSLTLESTHPPRMPYFTWCEKQGTLYINDKTMTGTINSSSSYGNCLPAWAQLELKADTLAKETIK
ncbi:MAG: hypothetical protein BWY70_01674 [Bacteroidetes bacterium ADurb.Bin408]|nr:MAG: hypothetical protein BWY70_01674 [Bacteroidetes bacterium ADurb.Bin408]